MNLLKNARAFVFDAYGTLFDVHSAVDSLRPRFGEKADALSRLWRTKQLEYTWLRSLMGRHADFSQVTSDALDHAMDVHGIDDPAAREALLSAYLHLAPYPEVPAMLRALRETGLRTAILSNGSPKMLSAAVDSARLREHLDFVLSVEEVSVYKPDPRVYRLACNRMKLRPAEIAFVSANGWDIAGASSFGLRAVWVNRLGQKRERLPGAPVAELESLSRLLDLYREA